MAQTGFAIAVALTLALSVGAAAALLSARRAVMIDSMQALRTE